MNGVRLSIMVRHSRITGLEVPVEDEPKPLEVKGEAQFADSACQTELSPSTPKCLSSEDSSAASSPTAPPSVPPVVNPKARTKKKGVCYYQKKVYQSTDDLSKEEEATSANPEPTTLPRVGGGVKDWDSGSGSDGASVSLMESGSGASGEVFPDNQERGGVKSKRHRKQQDRVMIQCKRHRRRHQSSSDEDQIHRRTTSTPPSGSHTVPVLPFKEYSLDHHSANSSLKRTKKLSMQEPLACYNASTRNEEESPSSITPDPKEFCGCQDNTALYEFMLGTCAIMALENAELKKRLESQKEALSPELPSKKKFNALKQRRRSLPSTKCINNELRVRHA